MRPHGMWLVVATLATTLGGATPAAAVPAVRDHSTIGHSVKGRPLLIHNVGARSSETKVLVVGSIHGNELAGLAVLRQLTRLPRPTRFELWLIVALNPDGVRAGTRQNARGVDLNRNWSRGWRPGGAAWSTYYPGPRPWSEPETRAARRFIVRTRPDVTLWYHQHMALVTRMKRHVRIQRRYARRVGLPLTRLERLPGTATRWQNHRFPGHTAFVVELPAGSLSLRAARRHARAVLEIGRLWAARHRSTVSAPRRGPRPLPYGAAD